MTLEGEALLVGTWKNIEELEASLTLEELELIVSAVREKEMRMFKFYASMKGVNLDEDEETAGSSFEEIEKRAKARLAGKTEEELDFAALGIEVEVIE